MFDSLTGPISFPEPNIAVIQVGGVAFRCKISSATHAALSGSQEARVYTHLNVREDALELFGFADPEERSCFLLLTTVSGVGPKAAFSILSVLTPAQLAEAVAAGDVKAITAANGVGPKVAQRVILEMKGKLKNMPFAAGAAGRGAPSAVPSAADDEAVEALMSLGYTASEASSAVAANRADSLEETVRLALKSLMKG